jgi:MFS family permease
MTHTERTYYFITCLYRLSWSALGPTYAVFLLSRGLDILHVNLVLAVYLITTCVFEVPTGAVADLFGRKISFLLSCVIRAVAFGLYYFSDTFAEFLVAEFIDAIGTTLATGAFDAWAVDGMHDEGNKRPVDRLFARANIMGQLSAIVGGFGAAQLAERDLTWPWLIGTAGFLLCAVAGAVLMRERRPPVASFGELRAGAYLSIGTMVRDGFATVQAIPVMRGLCLLTMLTSFATVPAFQMWQPRLQGLAGEGPWLLGWVWVFLNLSLIAGSALIPRLVGRWGRATTLAVAYGWRGLTLGVAALAVGFPTALVAFLLQEIGWGVTEPVLQAWMNEHATSKQRATILSVRSMAFTLGGAAGLVCLGFLARETSIANAWLVTASLYLVAVPGYLLLGRVARRYERGAVVDDVRAIA